MLYIIMPWYTGGDFMSFVPAADFCSRDNFATNFRIFCFIFKEDWWRWPIDFLITCWSNFVVTLNLNFQGQIWNFFLLNQEWSDCRETKSKHVDWNLGLKCDHRVWPWPWPWPWIFKVKCGISYISVKNKWEQSIFLLSVSWQSHHYWLRNNKFHIWIYITYFTSMWHDSPMSHFQ